MSVTEKAVVQKWLNADEYYLRSEGDKIIVNDLNFYSVNDLELVNNNLMTIYNTDVLSTIPECDCGETKGRFKRGKICDVCGTKVKELNEKVHPLLWLFKLENDLQFINPDFWLSLRTVLYKNVDMLRWMSDPKYNPPVTMPVYIEGIKGILKERSYRNLVAQLGEVLEYLTEHSYFKKEKKQKKLQKLLNDWNSKKDVLLSDYLPIINKRLFVMENTTKGKFTNLAVAGVIDVVMSWIKAVSEETTPKKRDNLTATTVSKLADLYYTYFDKHAVKKVGIFRKHVYGGRSHFTFRSVIVPQIGPHHYQEIHVPWTIFISTYRPYILNYMMKDKIPYNKASELLFASVKRYSKYVHGIINTIIASSKYELGLPVLGLRNQ